MGDLSVFIPVRAGAVLSGTQVGMDQCFTFGFNAAGDAEIVGFVGPVPAPGQLPNTSTDQSGPSAALTLVIVAALATGVNALARRVRSARS